MARKKVKVLKNHTAQGKIRTVGTEYLCQAEFVEFRVKIGLVEEIKEKKKKDAGTGRKGER